MEPALQSIIEAATSGPQRGAAYNKTAEFCDRWGWRLSGSTNLAESTADLEPMLQRWDGMEVRYEPANIPRWEREGLGWAEECSLVEPRIGSPSQPALEKVRQQKLDILGLGKSEGTPAEGITAEAIVVTSWQDLWEKRDSVEGKIVVYAVDWEGYSLTTRYRSRGASMAARFGARAALIRSAASFSIASPHTGKMVILFSISCAVILANPKGITIAGGGGYMHDNGKEEGYTITADSSMGKQCPFFVNLTLPADMPRIPHAGLATEDSDMLRRMAARDERIVIKLVMGGKNFPFDPRGRNTIAEIRGSEKPDEIVLISGHIDSWDVGQGAMDDAGPAFIAQQALNIVKQLGLQPKRTLRWVGWTTEEQGNRPGTGAQSFPGTAGGGAYFRL